MKGKKIIIGVTGSIAAYKSVLLVRLLIKAGCEVKVILTEAAADFVTPLTFSTLSKNEVIGDLFSKGTWSNHVELGLWADAFVIAPCTANTLGKLANGLADNMLVATYLSAKCPVYIAPAMDLDMWKHGSTKSNLERLTSFGNILLPVAHGELASGLVGEGRMAEPEDIFSFLETSLSKKKDLANKTVLITAGPTYEKLDPVRYIGNPSTGKMGVAIAEECNSRGAIVHLVLGPSKLVPENGIQVHNVMTTEEMYQASTQVFEKADIAIMAAAVADYTPVEYSDHKIKKKDGNLMIELQRTKDIAGSLGKVKKSDQILVGFALETANEEANAKSKLERKNFDFIVLNSLNNKGAGFKHDTNQITIISRDKEMLKYKLKSKKKVAVDIVNEIVERLSR